MKKNAHGEPKPGSLQVVRTLSAQNGAANEPELWFLWKHQCRDRALATHLTEHSAAGIKNMLDHGDGRSDNAKKQTVVRLSGFPADTSCICSRQLVKVVKEKASKHGGTHVHFVHGLLNLLGVENRCQCLRQHLVPKVLGSSILREQPRYHYKRLKVRWTSRTLIVQQISAASYDNSSQNWLPPSSSAPSCRSED